MSARQRAVYRRRRLAVSGLGLILVGVLVLGVQGAQALISGLTAPGTPSVPLAVGSLDPSETPVRLDVPAAGISVPLTAAGLTAEGEINPPQGEVMWYTGHDRATPGRLGTAVIAGHVSYYSEPDVFADLSQVADGDKVTITFADGVALEMDIVSTHLVEKDELQSSDLVWGDQKDRRRVAIVTCDETLGFGDDGQRKANFVAVAELG
jgi:LPXTG-site transpeptidase (sortase) family protein